MIPPVPHVAQNVSRPRGITKRFSPLQERHPVSGWDRFVRGAHACRRCDKKLLRPCLVPSSRTVGTATGNLRQEVGTTRLVPGCGAVTPPLDGRLSVGRLEVVPWARNIYKAKPYHSYEGPFFFCGPPCDRVALKRWSDCIFDHHQVRGTRIRCMRARGCCRAVGGVRTTLAK